MKTKATNWEEIFVNFISGKVITSSICNEFSKLNNKKEKKETMHAKIWTETSPRR